MQTRLKELTDHYRRHVAEGTEVREIIELFESEIERLQAALRDLGAHHRRDIGSHNVVVHRIIDGALAAESAGEE